MKGSMRIGTAAASLLIISLGATVQAQQEGAASPNADASAQAASATGTVVPRLVQFSGAVTDATGKPVSGPVPITFSLYTLQEGGTPLWTETQNITLDSEGRYTALLGANSPDGLPLDLFTSGTARWLGVTPDLPGTGEQPRVLLVGMPYALKAADADTLGGLPASAFVQTAAGSVPSAVNNSKVAKSKSESSAFSTIVGAGTTGFMPLWTGNYTIQNSNVFQTGNNLGVGTSTPTATLDVNGTTNFRGLATFAQSQTFPGTATTGTNTFAGNQTINGTLTLTGLETFASGQTFPGTATTGANSFTANQSVTGNVTATGSISGSTASFSGRAGTAVATITQSGSGPGLQVTSASGPSLTATNSEATGTSPAISGFISTNATGAAAIFGGSNGFSGSTAGVYGLNQSNSGGAAGVEGQDSAPTGATIGVFGLVQSNSSGASGVYGLANGPSGSSFGVEGVTNSITTGAAGVMGSADNQGGNTTYGVYGTSAGQGTGSAAVYGDQLSTAGLVYGVQGWANSQWPGSAGVYGTSYSSSSTGRGIDFDGGVWGDTGYENGAGVLATADNGPAVIAMNNSNSLGGTLYIVNLNQAGNLFYAQSAWGGDCEISGQGDLYCSGSISGSVRVDGGSRRVALYGVEAAQNWFEDFGFGQLSNGVTTVRIERTFAQTVNTGTSYHVFLTPEGDCQGLYVAQKSPNSFEVRELGGGKSSVTFDYRIVALRKGYEGVRLADVTKQLALPPALRAVKARPGTTPPPAPPAP